MQVSMSRKFSIYTFESVHIKCTLRLTYLTNTWKIKLHKSVFAVIIKFPFFVYPFSVVPLHPRVYYRIVWYLNEFDVYMAKIKTNVCCRIVKPILKQYSAWRNSVNKINSFNAWIIVVKRYYKNWYI